MRQFPSGTPGKFQLAHLARAGHWSASLGKEVQRGRIYAGQRETESDLEPSALWEEGTDKLVIC